MTRRSSATTYNGASRGSPLPAIVGPLAVLGTASLFPVAAVTIAIVGICLTTKRAAAAAGFAAVGIAASLLAWINVGKSISGDWAWYTRHYVYLETLPLDQYLGHRIDQYLPAVTEPVYYTISSVVSRLTGASIPALAIVVTLLIYLTIGTAIVLTALSQTRDGWAVVAASLLAILTGLTFTLSTHLVRQEIAAAFIGIGIVLAGKRRYAAAVVALVIAVLTHNSALIPAAGVMLATLLARTSRGPLLRTALSAVVFFVLGRLYLADSGNTYDGRSDGTISVMVIALDLPIVATFSFLVLRRGLAENRIARVVLFCIPVLYGFVIAIASQPIPLLRMYFYVEVLRALMVTFIAVYLMRGRGRELLGLALIAIGVLYTQVRIWISPFTYEIDLIRLLFASPLLGLR